MIKSDNTDIPQNSIQDDDQRDIKKPSIVDPLPESTRPRKDGPGGN
jgi:hypothetical protein